GVSRRSKQTRTPLPPYALATASPDPLKVGLHKAKRLATLYDPQAIEAPAFRLPEIFAAQKFVWPIPGEDDCPSSDRHPLLVFLDVLEANQAAAVGAWCEQPGHELDVEIIGLAERHVE